MVETFSDDAPKQNPWTEDRLGYAPFAKRLAETILGMNAPNGYVVGLHGAWGSGKSTALKFVQAYIKKHQDENDLVRPLMVVDFRPWMVSGHLDLVSSFFKVLSEALTPEKTSRWQSRGKKALTWVRSTSDPVVDAAAKVAIAAHPLLAPVLGAGAGAFKSSLGKAVDRWLQEPSLQSAYEDLSRKLQKKAGKILVIIDDIDRLTAEEIRSIMQMVKTVGSLPNVIYLLAYDRTIVGEALDASANIQTTRPRFTEKIVQHELELPVPATDTLLKLLDSEASFLEIGTEDTMRRYDLANCGFKRWITCPRDVGRISNAIKFAWPSLQNEIDPFDFLCMEAIRLFDQRLFYWIRDNREFLMGESFRFTRDEERNALISALKESLPSSARPDSIKIISALFPQRAKAFQGKDAFGSELSRVTQMRRAIAFAPSYDAYFRLQPQPDALPKSLVDKAISGLDDFEIQRSILQQLIENRKSGASLTKQFLEEMQFCIFESSAPRVATQALLDALLSVGDQILDLRKIPRGILEFPPSSYLMRLLKNMFEQWGKDATGTALIKAFGSAKAICLCAAIFVDVGREIGKINSEHTKRADRVTPQAYKSIGDLLLILIRSHASPDWIDHAPYYFDVARAWAYLADVEEPRAWLADGARSSPKFLSKVAYGLLTHSTSSSGSFWQLSSRDLEPWYDPKALIEACEKFDAAPSLTEEERAQIKALLVGLTSSPYGE